MDKHIYKTKHSSIPAFQYSSITVFQYSNYTYQVKYQKVI